jgi:hypothetical protein
LNNNVCNTNNDICNIKVILNVIKVTTTVSDQLFELIVSWIDQTYQDWNDKPFLEFLAFIIQNVSDVNVNDEGKHVEAVESYADDVMIVGIGVPFE